MALFMDAHTIEGGVAASDVAAAHQADLATQDAYSVSYRQYWVDEAAGKIFCLVQAPDAEAAATVHREAHGLVADEIYAVTEAPDPSPGRRRDRASRRRSAATTPRPTCMKKEQHRWTR